MKITPSGSRPYRSLKHLLATILIALISVQTGAKTGHPLGPADSDVCPTGYPLLLGPNTPEGKTSITAYQKHGSLWHIGGYSTSPIFTEGHCSNPQCAFIVIWHLSWDIIARWVFNDLSTVINLRPWKSGGGVANFIVLFEN